LGGCGQNGEFGKEAKALRLEMHTVLKQVDYDYQRMQYNTVVSGAMKMINALEASSWIPMPRTTPPRMCLTKALAFCCAACTRPRRTSRTLWQELGYAAKFGRPAGRTLAQGGPEAALVQDEIELMLQINGKLRGSIVVAAGADKAADRAAALASEVFIKQAAGAKRQKGGRGARSPGQRGDLKPWVHASLWQRDAWFPGFPGASTCGRCGFKLRQRPTLPFSTIAVTPEKAPAGPVIWPLPGRACASGGTAAGGIAPAQVILDVLQEQREKQVVGVNASGQVREFQLRMRINFRLRTPKGGIDRTEMCEQRDISFTESAVLSKEAEETCCTATCRPTSCSSSAPAGSRQDGCRRRLLRPCNSPPPSSASTCKFRGQLGNHLQRCTPCTATNRCCCRKRLIPFVPWRAARATPSAPCTRWPARTLTGARCWPPVAR
jgi:outer membrane lipopolysaccharide assembly protein LptE/RlpB